MNELPDDLQAILSGEETAPCLEYFAGMPEEQRRKLAPACLAWCRRLEPFVSGINFTRTNPLTEPAAIAVFCTARLAEVKKLGWSAVPGDDDALWILNDRKPDWIEGWVESLLEDELYWTNWALIRRLVRADLCKRPQHPNYFLGMISGLCGRSDDSADLLREALLSNRDLLEDELWRLFEFDGGGENSLANYDRSARGAKWQDTLVDMARRGELPRERLLDSTLDALERDFSAYRARWFFRFHDALEPTSRERFARATRYLNLLHSTIPSIVSYAFKAVRKLHSEQPYPVAELCIGLRSIVGANSKSIVRQSLTLASNATKGSHDSDPELGRLAAMALGHEHSQVQGDALALLEKRFPEPAADLRSACLDQVEWVAAEHRKRLLAWVGSETEAEVEPRSSSVDWRSGLEWVHQADPELVRLAGLDDVEALTDHSVPITAIPYDGTGVPRLRQGDRLSVIRDLDELVVTIAQVIEDSLQIDEYERCLDAMCLGVGKHEPDFSRRVGPVLSRARKILDPVGFSNGGVQQSDFCLLVVAWANQELVDSFGEYGEDPLFGFLSRRSHGLAKLLVAGQALPSLGAATHSGGWIDPMVLSQRMRAIVEANAVPVVEDLILALLRLPPEGRPRALADAPSGESEWLRACRYALGEPSRRLGRDLGLWASAARSLQPESEIKALRSRFRKDAPNVSQVATYHFAIERRELRGHTFPELVVDCQPPAPKRLSIQSPVAYYPWLLSLRENDSSTWRWSEAVQVVRASTIWPAAMENYFAVAVEAIGNSLSWSSQDWQNPNYLLPLLDPNVPLKHTGTLLVALALGAKEPGESGLGVDAAIAAIEDGRWDSARLGSIVATLLSESFVPAKRFAKTMADVARTSCLHSEAVRDALQSALVGDKSKMPRDIVALLELLLELSIQLGAEVDTAECRRLLESYSGRSRAATTARKLLEYQQNDELRGSTRTHALAVLVAGRSRRLEEWNNAAR